MTPDIFNSAWQVMTMTLKAKFMEIATRPAILQIARFGIIGAAATLVHMGVAFVLYYGLDFAPLIANPIAFLLAWCVSYTGQFKWTFKDSGAQHKSSAPKFFAVSVLSLILSQIVVWVTAELLGLPFYLAMICVVFSVPVVTFILSKFWVFRGKPSEH